MNGLLGLVSTEATTQQYPHISLIPRSPFRGCERRGECGATPFRTLGMQKLGWNHGAIALLSGQRLAGNENPNLMWPHGERLSKRLTGQRIAETMPGFKRHANS